jgi:hypothetical protein
MANIETRPLRAREDGGPLPLGDRWLPTPLAARALGVSPRSLKRYGHPLGGFLVPGVHWTCGPYSNSTARWDVPACREVLHRRGMAAIAAVNPGQWLVGAGR